jgi:class 3 adenylate cyclase/predicted ATPase
LFADIKGSMELIEDLDPEEARAIIDPALKLMIDAANHYGGYIIQSTGDGIFALFGAPVAHEDHPQRALYAALRMQEDIRRFAERLRAEKGLNLQARVGASVGDVVVRSIQTGESQVEYTPIGHSISLASRLQTLANPGSIAISESLRRLVEGYFTLEALGPALIRGSSEPVNVYEVLGLGPLRTRLQRAAARGLTKFVGRQREMEALEHTAERARSGHGQIVAVIADPGVGKSRLFYEFKATSQSGWMVLEAFSVSHGKASAYLPVIGLLQSYFGITLEDGERKRREVVADKIAILDRALEDTLPYLFSLLGIVEGEDRLAQMDGLMKKRRTLEAIKRILLRESLNQPLIVVFEDLHWIDGETQALLNLLADGIANARVLLMVNYRPEYHHEWGNRTYYTQLRLDPLGKENADEMLSVLLGDAVELVPLKQTIIERTEGNPFFIEELVQALFEEGALVRNGTVKLARSVSTLHLPPTTQGVLAGRIDRLPAEQKELLQTLAVLGKEFSVGLIRRVVQRSDDELDHILAELQLAEFIYEQPAVGDLEYIFKHALTQEVAYNSLLIERRKLLHERTGRGLESMFADQLDDHVSELAHHYSHSENIEKAVEYLLRAGQQALQRCAYAEAISTLNAGMDLLQKLPDSLERIQQELPLQLALGQVLMAIKGIAATEVERAYTRARELCEQLGDRPELFQVLFGLYAVYFVRGEMRPAHDLAAQLLRPAQSADDPVRLMFAHLALGFTSYQRGALLLARHHIEKALPLYDRERRLAFRLGGTDGEVMCLSYLAFTLWTLGYPDQALKRVNDAIGLARELSHPFSLVFAEDFAGFLHLYRREAPAAQEHGETVIALSTEHGMTEFFEQATFVCGVAMAGQGRIERGTAQMQVALRASGLALRRPTLLIWLAEAYMEGDRFDEGLRALAEALTTGEQHEDRQDEPEKHRVKGELLLRHNHSGVAEAQNCFQRAIEIARQQSAKSYELRATMSLARLLAKQGKRQEAGAMLAEIYNWFTEGFDSADLKDAKALLDELTA